MGIRIIHGWTDGGFMAEQELLLMKPLVIGSGTG
jgi:hypothetical protein